MSSKVFKLDENVLFGVVYIPPECTSYSSQEAFNDIYFDIRYFARLYEYISLAGNCNTRITELNDFSVFTENYFLNEDTYLLEQCTSFLTDSNLPLKKNGLDNGQNKSGKLLINLCKGHIVLYLSQNTLCWCSQATQYYCFVIYGILELLEQKEKVTCLCIYILQKGFPYCVVWWLMIQVTYV
jgi:hypothetical protein